MPVYSYNIKKMTIESKKSRTNDGLNQFTHYELFGNMYGFREDGTKELLQEDVVMTLEFDIRNENKTTS